MLPALTNLMEGTSAWTAYAGRFRIHERKTSRKSLVIIYSNLCAAIVWGQFGNIKFLLVDS